MVKVLSKGSPIVKTHFERVGPGRYRDECPTRESDWDTEEEDAAVEAMSDPYCGYEPDTEADEDSEESRERLVYIGQDLIIINYL